MSILLKSAVIIDSKSPHNLQQKDILIRNNKIEKIADSIDRNQANKVIELENLHISSGWFDTSVSFGEPGFEERETLKNGLLVAAKSGFTSVAINSNTNPVIDNKSAVEFLINQAKNSNITVYPIGSLSQKSEGKELAELYDMQQSGAIAFGDYNKPVSNDNLMKLALLYAQNFEGLVLSFPKNNSISSEGIANEGEISTKLGLKGIPDVAEHLQITRDLFLLEYTGGKLHIPTISTAKSAQLIKEAKKKGLNVTCSVAAHHLFLTDSELVEFDSNFKVTPPLRTSKDVKALIKAIKEGVIDIITSDHNPIDIENKKLEFSRAKDGTIGLETLFGVVNSVLDIETIIKTLTVNPKNIFGIENTLIKEGAKADLTLFSPKGLTVFTKKDILSTSKNSIFLGKTLNGKVYGTYANSKLTLNS